MKVTTRRRIDGRRHIPDDDSLLFASSLGIGAWEGFEKGRGIRVKPLLPKALLGCILDDLSQVHDENPGRDEFHHGQGPGDPNPLTPAAL